MVDQFRGVPAAGVPGFNYYDPVQLQDTLNSPTGSGIRLQVGYFDPDDSGLVVEGFGQNTAETFDARDTLGPGRGEQKNTLRMLLRPPDFLLNDIGGAGSQFGQTGGGGGGLFCAPARAAARTAAGEGVTMVSREHSRGAVGERIGQGGLR